MKIVFLDAKTIGDDIDLSGFDAIGDVTRYAFSTSEEVPERVKDADVIIVNKIQINESTIGTAEDLKLVCVTATGTNNLDKDYLDKRGIAWRNVAGYSTESVAQHTLPCSSICWNICDTMMNMSNLTVIPMTQYLHILKKYSTN